MEPSETYSLSDMNIKIGDRVAKKSGKPFKSGGKINTVTGFTTNPHDPKHSDALLFAEDDSCVNAHLCKIVTN